MLVWDCGPIYYKFSDNVAWVRDATGEWYQSGIYSNEKHFLKWIRKDRFKVEEITVQELFVDLI